MTSDDGRTADLSSSDTSVGDTSPPASPPRAGTGWDVTVGVFVAFLAYSALARPLPSVNEPHYLTKAKHYWQPDWCAGDFFLESSNPHLVFYQTIGVFTQWLTLDQTAWVGRVIGLALLAWGWTRLLSRLGGHRWSPFRAACWFLLLQSLGNFSGEWVVGGTESKVFAYAFGFAGWASVIDGRALPAGVWLGLAMSFHPVVGGWCVIALVMSWAFQVAMSSRFAARFGFATCVVPKSQWLLGGVLFVIVAMPGVIPALQMLGNGGDLLAEQADRIQVGTRLAHHLDPLQFSLAAYRYYALLLVVGLLLQRRLTSSPISTPELSSSPAKQTLVGIVSASLVIAMVGVVVGWGARPLQDMWLSGPRVWLLKFYPFRLADVLVPMLVSITIGSFFDQWVNEASSNRRRWIALPLTLLSLVLALSLPHADRNPSRMSPSRQADWRAVCEWIRVETPTDSVLYVANEDWAPKWFCHRAEYVNYKDCPQDSAGIIEWLGRLQTIQLWHRDAFRDGRCSAEELDELHEQTGITHLLVRRLGPIDASPVHRNDSFRVYSLTDIE